MANDLKLFIENCGDSEVLIAFQNVKFSIRSFMDEFYNLFVKESSDRQYVVKLTNVPEDIKIMLDSVSRTQNGVKTIPETARVTKFKTVDEFLAYMSTMAF